MAYQRDDGLWCPSTKLEGRSQVDFYSQLKKKYNYLDTGEFYSIQGINIPAFEIIQQVKLKLDCPIQLNLLPKRLLLSNHELLSLMSLIQWFLGH